MGRGLRRRACKSSLIAPLVVAIVLGACGDDSAAPASTDSAGSTLLAGGAGSGTVTIGGERFEFEASTCLSDPTEFTVEGHGSDEEGDFVVVLDSSGTVEVVYGVESGVETPSPDHRWFQAVEGADLDIDGRKISGTATFVQINAEDRTEVEGSIDVRCAPDDPPD